jgi:hypothetical protein
MKEIIKWFCTAYLYVYIAIGALEWGFIYDAVSTGYRYWIPLLSGILLTIFVTVKMIQHYKLLVKLKIFEDLHIKYKLVNKI